MANIVDGCVQGTLSRDLIMWARRENKTAASESVLFRPFRPLINRIKTTFIKIRENNSSVLNTETSEMDWGFLFCSDHEKWKKWEREEENGWVRQRARERVVMIEPSDTRKEARKKIECINQEREREREEHTKEQEKDSNEICVSRESNWCSVLFFLQYTIDFRKPEKWKSLAWLGPIRTELFCDWIGCSSGSSDICTCPSDRFFA